MRFSTLASLLLAFGCLGAAEVSAIDIRYVAKPDAQLSLETAIPAAIDLMELRQYESFFRQFIQPEDLERILKDEKMDELVARFSNRHHHAVLASLRHIQDVKPTYDDEGTTAIFHFEREIGGMEKLSWRRIAGRWYISN